MSDCVNFLLHTTFDPNFVYIKEPKPRQESATQSRIERVALLALPFLSLYRPLGTTISISLGAYHSVSHLVGAVSAGTEGAWKKCALLTAQTGLAILTIGASLFHFRIGLLLTTGIDIAKNGFALGLCLYQLEYVQALGKGLELSAGIFYLGIMMTGALEIVLLALVLQAVTCFYQAYKEYNQERYPEVIAKIAMGMIRLFQVNQTRELIQKRDLLLAIQKYKNLQERVQRGKQVRALLKNPLLHLQKEIQENRVVFSDAKNREYEFGSHFHGHGGQLVKGENLILQNKMIEEQPVIELTFKVNSVFRDKIQELIEEIEGMDPKEIAQALQLFGSHATGICIDRESPLGKQEGYYRITFTGLGSIQLGDVLDPSIYPEQEEWMTDFSLPNLHNRVVVQLENTKTLFDLYELLAMLSLEKVVAISSLQEQEIHKLFFLYHMFAPREATELEHKEKSWDLSSEQLRAEMVKKSPEMQEIFDLIKVEKGEILPGRMRYRIPDLSERAYAEGARGLIATITGADSSEELYDRVASILKMGMLSNETRAFYGIHTSGIGQCYDFLTGGADSVFVQMITENNCRGHMNLRDLGYAEAGGVHFLLSLKNLDTGTYQCVKGHRGIRRVDGLFFGDPNYLNRPNLFEFTKTLQTSTDFIEGNEVMVKERISPDEIGGILVATESQKANLLQGLRSRGVIQLDSNHQESILGISSDQFVRVSEDITEKLITV